LNLDLILKNEIKRLKFKLILITKMNSTFKKVVKSFSSFHDHSNHLIMSMKVMRWLRTLLRTIRSWIFLHFRSIFSPYNRTRL